MYQHLVYGKSPCQMCIRDRFKTGMGQDKEVKVKAYDQIRYCKAKDTITIENETLTDLVTRMCNFFQLQTGSLMPTGYVLQAKPQCDKTWLDIIYGAVGDTLIGTEHMYCLRDEYCLLYTSRCV